MAHQTSVVTLDEVLDGEYRRCYVDAEPVDPKNAAHVAAAREFDGKYGEPDGSNGRYRTLAQRLAHDLDLTGVATVELRDKDNEATLTWDVATNEWAYRFDWDTYTQSGSTTATGVWDPRA